jgi:hypothetical protein
MVHASQSDPVVLLSASQAPGLVRQLDQEKPLMSRKVEAMTVSAALDSVTSEFALRDFTGASRSEVMRTLLAEHPKEDPFYCVDLRWVAVKYAEWKENLPRVRPFMAVKCMPDKAIMTLLHRLGAGFDCASKGEIEAVRSLGAEPDNILYANPCKMASHLRAAKEHGVRQMTFDNEAELLKVQTRSYSNTTRCAQFTAQGNALQLRSLKSTQRHSSYCALSPTTPTRSAASPTSSAPSCARHGLQ